LRGFHDGFSAPVVCLKSEVVVILSSAVVLPGKNEPLQPLPSLMVFGQIRPETTLISMKVLYDKQSSGIKKTFIGRTKKIFNLNFIPG
jgi:hypothetical protein